MANFLDKIKELTSRKAVVAPSDMFREGSSGSGGFTTVPTYPINFPGWPDLASRTSLDVSDRKTRAKIAVQSTWVTSNINAIAQEFSTAKLCLADDDGTELEEHPFLEVWNEPNPWMGRAFISQYLVWQLMLFGQGYLYMAPFDDDDEGDSFAEVWPVPSMFMRPVAGKDQFIEYYYFKVPGTKDKGYLIDADYIVYSRFADPFDLRGGMPPLESGFTAAQSDILQRKWNRDFFGQHNALPSAIISTKPDVAKRDFAQFKEELYQFYGAGQRRTLVARGGEIDVELLQLGQREMDFVMGRKFSRDEVDRAFGIPEGYWSAIANVTNARHAKAVLIENAVWPRLVQLAEDLQTQYLKRLFPDVKVYFEDIRPRNIEIDLRVAESRKSTWTLNELREEEGLEPLTTDPLWDEVPAEVAIRVYAPGGNDAAVEDTPIPPVVETEPEVDEDETVDDVDDEEVEDIFAKGHIDILGEASLWRRKALNAMKRGKSAAVNFQTEHISPLFAKRTQARLSLCKQRDEVFRVFDVFDVYRDMYIPDVYGIKQLGDVPLIQEMPDDWEERVKRERAAQRIFASLMEGQAKRVKAFLKDQIKNLEDLPDDLPGFWTREERQLVQLLLPFFDDTLLLGAQSGIEQLGEIVVDLDEVNDEVLDVAKARAQMQATSIVEASKRSVDRVIATWIEVGGTQQDLLKRVERVWPDSRAQTYAITSVTNAYAQGNKIAWKTSRAVKGFRFHTVEDKRVCPICRPNNDKVFDLDDETETPALHDRCRCFITPEVRSPEEMAQLR